MKNDIENSVMLSTYFAPIVGYDKAAKMADFAISKNIFDKTSCKGIFKAHRQGNKNYFRKIKHVI